MFNRKLALLMLGVILLGFVAASFLPLWKSPQQVGSTFNDYMAFGHLSTYQHDYEAAIKLFTQALELRPNDSEAHLCRGNDYALIGDLDKAIDDYNKAVQADDKSADTFAMRATALRRKQKYDEALSDLDKAISISPQSFYYHSRADVYERKNDLEKAIADCDAAIRISPQDDYAYYLRGFVRRRQSRHDEAIKDFTDAIRLDPKDPYYFMMRGREYEVIGDQSRAR